MRTCASASTSRLRIWLRLGCRRNEIAFSALCSRSSPKCSKLFCARLCTLKSEWETYHVLSGQPVWVTLSEEEAVGAVVAGVDNDGALLAQTAAGLRRFQSGDVSLRLAQDTLSARRMRSG